MQAKGRAKQQRRYDNMAKIDGPLHGKLLKGGEVLCRCQVVCAVWGPVAEIRISACCGVGRAAVSHHGHIHVDIPGYVVPGHTKTVVAREEGQGGGIAQHSDGGQRDVVGALAGAPIEVASQRVVDAVAGCLKCGLRCAQHRSIIGAGDHACERSGAAVCRERRQSWQQDQEPANVDEHRCSRVLVLHTCFFAFLYGKPRPGVIFIPGTFVYFCVSGTRCSSIW